MSGPTSVEALTEALTGEYSSRLVASLEMLTAEPVHVERISGAEAGATGGDLEALPWIWHCYSLSTTPPCEIWTGATAMAGNAIGTKVLLAAGIDEIAASDVQDSYAEVQQGAVSALAQWIGRQVAADVSLSPLGEPGEAPGPGDRRLLRVTVGEETLDRMCLALPDSLRALLRGLADGQNQQVSSGPSAADAAKGAANSTPAAGPAGSGAEAKSPAARSMERILDFELPMTVSFGKARLPLREVLRLSTGSIIELDRSIVDPVEIIVNNRVVGRGEVVVVDGNYGIRIQEIVTHGG